MKPGIFGAYDIRGKYPEDINENTVKELIPIILKILGKGKRLKVVVGRDTRLSSPSLYEAAINVLSSLTSKNYKVEVVHAGMITTPMIYFLVDKLGADGGIVVTASHNSKEYNGVKVVNANGLPISGQDIYELYKSLR